jgi:acetylornithine deacetylase/succinyl-diaminopimelate desuccinylase-like protein
MHKVDECVSISDLRKLTSIYHDILVEYFRWSSIKLKNPI